MDKQERKYGSLEHLIDEALGEAPAGSLSPDFAARVLEKVEKPDVLKELAFESTMKVGLLIGAFLILATSFILFGITDLHSMEIFVLKYRQLLVPVLLVGLFTWLFNDIVLKYMIRRTEV